MLLRLTIDHNHFIRIECLLGDAVHRKGQQMDILVRDRDND